MVDLFRSVIWMAKTLTLFACSCKVYNLACCKKRRSVVNQTHTPVSPCIEFVFLRNVLSSMCCGIKRKQNEKKNTEELV